jgi:hypothetical protein
MADAEDVIHAVRKIVGRYRRRGTRVQGWTVEDAREAA